MTLEVIKSGFYTLVQDFGRFGLQRYGITNGGPLDEHAYLWANHLLGNHYTAAQLEISFGGVTARFTQNAMIAICGADLSAVRNEQPLASWQSHFMRAGDVISFAAARSGSRCYLAIKGGFDIKPQFFSCATVQREKLGGLYQNGDKLRNNDVLSFQASSKETCKIVPFFHIPGYDKQINLRFIPNRSMTGCDQQCLQQFSMQTYSVSQQIDRMGYRLTAEPIVGARPGIISQGLAIGSIQIPKDGQPIVLMRDRQTMGGYSLAGCVAYLDLSLLAQSVPGTLVTFSPVTVDQLEQELIAYKVFFKLDF